MTTKQKVGDNVRRRREQKGWTQEALGRKIGLRGSKQSTRTAIHRVERGEWSVGRIQKIADALGVKMSTLLNT